MTVHGAQSRPQTIVPHLWFDDRAEEAAAFYVSLFDGSRIDHTSRYTETGFEVHGRPAGSVMNVDFALAGYRMLALNGGPAFRATPAISFFVTCEHEEELDALWRALAEGGSTLMERKRYDWSDEYGWVQDRFGVTWQLSLGRLEDVGQKIAPCLTYVSEEGRAEQAVRRYVSLFDDSRVHGILHYGPGEAQPEGTVQHAQFELAGDTFMAMDSSPEYADFSFNEAISLLVVCDSQEEIDRYWDGLTSGGDPTAQQCGWLRDRFGVAWQVWPSELGRMLSDDDPAKVERATEAFLRMKKFDLDALRAAYRG